MAKGVKELGLMVPAELIGGVSAPIIAYAIYALNKLRKKKYKSD
jgi:hypothetical protein